MLLKYSFFATNVVLFFYFSINLLLLSIVVGLASIAQSFCYEVSDKVFAEGWCFDESPASIFLFLVERLFASNEAKAELFSPRQSKDWI
jgi:hypothetical protein